MTIKNQPNILWIFVEDICPYLSCYGYTNPTPNIDRLAEEGVRFEHAFSPCPVCSPARSAVVTGMMPSTLGTHHHQSSRSIESGVYLPDGVKPIPQILKEAGYYTFNRGKDDYNFMYQRKKLYSGEYQSSFWYLWEGEGHWRDREPGQPFFGQIQLVGGKQVFEPDFEQKLADKTDREHVELPPYYPDHPILREDVASHYDSVRITDREVKQIVEELRADGLLDNTILFFFSDHGMKSMRHKQFCYDGGIHVPLIIRGGEGSASLPKGLVRDDLVSSIDIAATTLALAGQTVPYYIEGQNLFSKDFRPRDYIIAGRDRCDFTIDHTRVVRNKRYKYFRNFLTDRPLMQPNYRDRRPEFLIMKQLYEEGKMTPEQAQFWGAERPSEELYDIINDPHEVNNLANDLNYRDILSEMRNILNSWIEATDDKGQYPEHIEALRFMYERWGERCVNPEFDIVKETKRKGAPGNLHAK